MRRRAVPLLCLAASLALAQRAAPANHEGSYLHEVTTKVASPHLDWARPLAGGPVSAFFVVPRTIAPREIVELAQRMDLDFAASSVFHSGLLAMESVYEDAVEGTGAYEKTREILAKLERPRDVYVLGNVSFDILPAEAKYRILERVSAGAGLVFFYDHRMPYKKVLAKPTGAAVEIMRGVSLAGMPGDMPAKAADPLATFAFGKGRVAVLKYPSNHSTYYGGLSLTYPETPSTRWKAHYENNMVLVARTVRWAAGRAPSVAVVSAAPSASPEAAVLALELKGADGPVAVSLRIRDDWNRVLSEAKVTCTVSGGAVRPRFACPPVPGGLHHFDYVVTRRGKVEDFGFVSLDAPSPVGALEIEPAAASFRKGTPVAGTLRVAAAPAVPASVLLELADAPHGRVWARSEPALPAGRAEIPFSLGPADIPTAGAVLTAEVRIGKATVARADRLLLFPKRDPLPYPNILWSGLPAFLTPIAMERVRAAGFDTALEWTSEKGLAVASLHDMRLMPYTYRIGFSADEKGWTQEYLLGTARPENAAKYGGDGSFYNPAVRDALKTRVAAVAQTLKDHSVLAYSLGDENFFSYTGGYGPSETAEYRRFLKARYPAVADLNREWGTSLDSFDAITPFPQEDLRTNKRFAAWYDHRLFMEKQYADCHHFLADVIRETDPGSRVGAEGSVPGNLEQTLSRLEFWGPYADPVMNEVLRSFAPEKLRTNWWGGYTGGERGGHPIRLWQPLVQGVLNGNSWYTLFGTEGYMAGDFSYARYFEELLPHLRALSRGTANLLIDTPLRKDGVAVLWSHASYSASFMDDRFFSPKDSIGPFMQHCYRKGVAFDFLSSRMVEEGRLAGYRILFLFGASALSARECSRIADFVGGGGIVVADLNPAVLNEHCRPLGRSGLSDLFGGAPVTGKAPFAMGPVKVAAGVAGRAISFEAEKVRTSPETGSFVVSRTGRGTAVLLNFNLGAAENTASPATPLSALLDGLLDAAGVRPACTVSGLVSDRPVVRLRGDDDLALVAVLGTAADVGATVTVSFPGERWFYRADGGFVSRGTAARVRMETPLLLLSAARTAQSPPDVAAPAKSAARGEGVALTFAPAAPGRTCRIEVVGPDGAEIVPARAILRTGASPLTAAVRFPYNDAPGVRRIIVTDIATGLARSFSVTVK